MLTGIAREMSRTVIGVSLEADAVRMAECRRGKVVRCSSRAYPPGVSPESEGFPVFLKTCMTGFSSRFRRVPVWLAVSPPSLQIRYLALPVVRRREFSDMVYWTFRKDLPFDPAHTLFDYGRELVWPDGKAERAGVTAYTVLREEVDAISARFVAAGIDLAGIVIPTFAMRHLLQGQRGVTAAGGGTCLSLSSGGDASSVIIVKDGLVRSSRIFKIGINAILGVIREREPGCTAADAFRRVRTVLETEEEGGPQDGVGEHIREVFDRLIQQVERTLAAYLNEHPDETFSGMYVMGAVAGLAPLVKVIGRRLGLAVLAGAEDSAAPAEAYHVMAMAAGASLSRAESTPNLLIPCHQREKAARRSWWSLLLAMLLALGVALTHLSVRVLQFRQVPLVQRLATEQARVAAYAPQVDERMLQAMAASAVADHLSLRKMAREWQPLAVFRALAVQTPADVVLTLIEVNGGAPAPGAGPARPEVAGGMIRIGGYIGGAREAQRSKLVAYALQLETSPLFTKTRVVHTADGMESDLDVLIFDMQMDINTVTGPAVPSPVPVKEVSR